MKNSEWTGNAFSGTKDAMPGGHAASRACGCESGESTGGLLLHDGLSQTLLHKIPMT